MPDKYSPWDPKTKTYKTARRLAKLWRWDEAAEIMGITSEYLQQKWGADDELRCPVSGRTWLETKALIARLNDEALALCRSPTRHKAIRV